MTLPALFISHGPPTMPLDDTPAHHFLEGLGDVIGKPKAVVIASGHWDTPAPRLNAVAVNDTIHDFYGFPRALYEMQYPAPGDTTLARRAATLLADAGLAASLDVTRGLDHGAWVPMLLMYPDADVPVVQLSLQEVRGAAHHIALGRALAPLRDEGVLVIGSGGFTHNLRALAPPGTPEPDWSRAFSDWVHEKLIARDDTALADYRRQAPYATLAQPTEDHFLPLFVAYGAGGAARRLHTSATMGALRLDAYAFE